MASVHPVLVALPLDHETPDIVATATELTRRLGAPTVVLHVIPRRRQESERGLDARVSEARRQLELHLAPLRGAGVEIQDVMVVVGSPAEEVVTTARRLAAQMIVTGGGRPATIRRWVFGSVAEGVVRRSSVPVWVARGEPPAGRPVLCPVDLSPESRVGLEAAIRMARLFQLPLSLISVVSEEYSRAQLARVEAAVRADLQSLVASYDVDDLRVALAVTSGDPAARIIKAAEQAGLMVIASRGYDPLVRDWLGPVTARALRYSHCSALTIRHLEEGHDERARTITRLADDYQRAKQLLADDRGEEAIPLLEAVAERALANAAIQEAFAIALERVGRDVEATSRRALARLIREGITPVD